ncbi:AAA domain-containing protein [Bacillus paralicheniformis]|uniref:AAA domain-containing protein n=1 Tax=Bacillus TaxID=1386 RepID=UPI0005B56BAA|nr:MULTISPECIES: AAA domain-containing protein [Bacillus]AJO16979.1 DNA helicase [Bacillus paralicheniformis]MBU5330226.1 DNA helicase [Bacillus paralicheniformis]MBU8747505.1 DNA helicase [Bacillus paralicheniformis]MBU8761564.1 DNA helicase [Bacillus paralicheniformis]MCR2017675.1 AAA domain-containing protein [Bacillus paralicheniformis]
MASQTVTKYFRDSVAAKLKINFKNSRFMISDLNSLIQGKIDSKYYAVLSDHKNVSGKLDVIVVAKTIKTKFDVQQRVETNIEDMTGILYIPAVLTANGMLLPSEDKYPWIPREHLHPIIDEELAIGYVNDFDEYMSNNYQRLESNLTWKSYFEFAKDMYESVTETEITSNTVKEIELEKNVYIFKDDSINATRNILKLYDHLLSSQPNHLQLYQNFINQKFTSLSPLIPNRMSEMQKHVGQMGGEYPLSPSQRECLNHFNNMEDGEILAVNGPPGTGKTTLLQSLVANLYVERALKKEDPPVIVASSTNNQAVTNIIESFGKIKPKWENNHLEQRWIEGVDSFAVYFPSGSKEKEAQEKGFQYTNPRGENFFDEVESNENIERSTEKMLKECSRYFETNHTDIKQCEHTISNRLTALEEIRQKVLSLFSEYDQIAPKGVSLDTYMTQLTEEKTEWESTFQSIQQRIKEWQTHFSNLPFFVRLFKFLPFFKSKLVSRVRYFIQPDEEFIDESMNLDKILSLYSEKAKETREKIKQIDATYQQVSKLNTKYKQLMVELISLNILEKYPGSFSSLDKANEFLDTTIKYASFWLAVHYYECRWLLEKRLSEKQRGTNFDNVLNQFYTNLSMLTPCFVMTFYQLPRMLLAYNNGKEHFLYNYIDLLIVDEAGQVTPEIAACSFSLAKRAVVVGDVYQIEPVWNINETLDISLALSNKVIASIEQFEKLRELGLNTSESSVMRVACKSCKYEKHQQRGLFLSEHRRCYDEIIEYCNNLVYRGKLEPMRGKAAEDKKNPLVQLSIPPLGHMQVDSYQSSKKAGSRYNEIEARAIATWINEHFYNIRNAYHEDDPKSLIGIITPFKMQVGIIKRALSPDVKPFIDVGTVHTFQGGERKVIIMSTVYGKNDGCFFIDANKSLLNVAVSRAKDSFLVMGDMNCLSDSANKPSGLLKRMLLENDVVHS